MKLYLKKTYGLFYFFTHPKNFLWVFEEVPEPHMRLLCLEGNDLGPSLLQRAVNDGR